MTSKGITIKKIKNRFKIIENEISQLVEDKYVFEKYEEYIENNKSINEQNEFLSWIKKNYQNLAVINVYKQVDTRNDVENLVNLLKDIRENKKLFTLQWYKRLWKPISTNTGRKISRTGEATEVFRKFSIKDNSVISSQKIDKDIKKIKRAINGKRFGKKRQSIESLTKYRHKRGAHFASDNKKAIVPVKKLFEAIDLLEKMIIKYNLLTNQAGMDTLLPSNIDDYINFSKIFRD